MDAAKWLKLKDLITAALDLPENERDAFLSNPENDEFRAEVEALIAAHHNAGGFIDSPIAIERGLIDDVENDALVGKQIADYSIDERLGAGGMGTVYLAHRVNSDFKQKVALKIIKRGMDSEAILQRFARERRILSTLRHSNIAQLLDGGISSDGVSFFVMEFVEGKPLNQYCRENNPSLDDILKIFREVCSAVTEAHKNLVIHRDLKPSNIIVSNDGIPKLLDFGIAKILSDEEQDTTATQNRILTPEYSSPEQLLGGNVTTGTDVYSLGVILYEILSGHRPFESKGKSFEEIVRSVCETDPIRPSSVIIRSSTHGENETDGNRRDRATGSQPENTTDSPLPNPRLLTGDLDNIILKALRKEPSERYGSVLEFSDDISRFLKNLPVSARPQTIRYRFEKYVRRHRVGVAAAAVVFLSLIGGTSIATWQAVVAQRERARAEQRFNQVRKIANTVLFDYHKGVKELPGSTGIREKMVKDSLEYLDNLSAESGYSLDLQRELALAYREVGHIQGNPASGGNLGNEEAALQSYRKALSIQEKVVAANPENLDDRRLIPRLLLDISLQLDELGRLDEAESNILKSVDLFQALAIEQPGEIKSRSDLARALWSLAAVVRARGDLDSARAHYGRAAETYEQLAVEIPENRNHIRNASLTYKNIGGLLEQQQEFENARKLYEKALDIDLRNTNEEPNNVQFKLDLSFSYGSLAAVSRNLGRHEEALVNIRKKQEIQEKVVAGDAKNAFARKSLGKTIYSLGEIYARLGRSADAIAEFQKSLQILREVSNRDSLSVDSLENLGLALTELGQAYDQTGNKRAAEKSFLEAESIFLDLRTKSPETTAFIIDLAMLQVSCGEFQVKNGNMDGAFVKFNDALRTLDSQPSTFAVLERKARIYEGLGDINRSRKRFQESRRYYDDCLAIWKGLQEKGRLFVENKDRIGQIQSKLSRLPR